MTTKLNYGMQWPHKAYDTVLNQVLAWLYEWGYPIIGPKLKKKPVVNVSYEEIEKAVDDAYKLRQAGA